MVFPRDIGIKLLWECVDYWAVAKPNAEALVFGEVRLTWAQVKEQVDRTAKGLLELGVQKGDRVAMVAMARPEFIISFMAASKIGAIWLGLSPKFTVDELRYLLGHSRPAVLITLSEYMGIDLIERGLTFGHEFPSILSVLAIGTAREGALDYQEFIDRPRRELDERLAGRIAEISPDDETLLMYTSGSTGKPKGVLHTHRNIIQNVAVEVVYFDLDDEVRVLLHFPINHVAADVELGYGTMYAGGTLILMDRFDAQASLEVIARERVSVVGQVPAMYLLQFQAPAFPTMNWSNVKRFMWGGSAAPPLVVDVLSTIAAETGARLITGYGSTELCGFVTYTAANDSREKLAASVGKAVRPYAVRIVDEHRREVRRGSVGEIAFRGPVLMKGYYNDPAGTTARIDADGWYYTSDLGRMDDAGYVYLVGRATEMFKSGGENVFPREIEDTLETHPAVLFAAVIGVPDPVYSEIGHAYIMLKPGYTATEDELHAYCKQHLANFKVPKHFSIRPRLPLLPNGKVDKLTLKRELAGKHR